MTYKLDLYKETEHFIVHWTRVDKACIDKVSEVLEAVTIESLLLTIKNSTRN